MKATLDELQVQAYNFLESLVSPVEIHDQLKPILNALLRISKQSVLIFWSGTELPIFILCSEAFLSHLYLVPSLKLEKKTRIRENQEQRVLRLEYCHKVTTLIILQTAKFRYQDGKYIG